MRFWGSGEKDLWEGTDLDLALGSTTVWLVVSPGTGIFSSLSLSFPICKMGVCSQGIHGAVVRIPWGNMWKVSNARQVCDMCAIMIVFIITRLLIIINILKLLP